MAAGSNRMLLDVKLDLKDGKCELYYLKNWVKCFVKIEAIQCFPCYLKISFFYHDDNTRESPLAVIRINIPGVRIETAASRTKAMAYGVFWKNNRKRCKLFFAFTEKAACTEHMCWLKQSIDSLEDYRKTILENHRISRSVIEIGSDACHSEKQTNKSRLAQIKDLNDVLGPLPAIPSTSMENNSRWSMRRVSGCSDIYEEILDPSARNDSQSDTSRKSVASGIYVDMTTPLQRIGGDSSEIPPPLPPRRRLTQNAYADIGAYTTKSKKSTWNLMSVFGRNKVSSDIQTNCSNDCLDPKRGQAEAEAATPYSKNRNIAIMSKSRSENLNIDLLASKHSSFSTPDLTNIVDVTQQPIDDADDADLDVMDIERSNSLNCSANQFLSRPPTLNISSNILWSFNLTSTLSSNCDSSAINLVGANVNGNSILQENLSGYCQMAPIIRKNVTPTIERNLPMEIISDIGIDVVDAGPAKRVIENPSGYCQMAPIINTDRPVKSLVSPVSQIDAIKNNTFEGDSFSLLEFSLLPNDKHSSNHSSTEENSSSGVSSDEGIIYATTTSLNSTALNDTQFINETADCNEIDDGVLIRTQSSMSTSSLNNILPPFHTTKFDEKYPSYFPNTNCTNCSVTKSTKRQTINHRTNEPVERKPLYERQKSKCANERTAPTSYGATITSPASPQHINYKKTNYKTVIKSTPAKVQKTKQRKCSSENIYVGTPMAAIIAGDENRCSYHRKGKNHKNSENCKFRMHQQQPKPKPTAIDTKNVLTHTDGNAKSHSFDKNTKIQKQPSTSSSSSSPRRIYNKCATLATRLKTPPTTPVEEFNCSRGSGCNTLPSISKSYSFDVVDAANTNETTSSTKESIGLLRFASLSRFRKIDFSPLKLKINNILQRPNIEI